MTCDVGIRREDKHVWEGRAPLTPAGVAELTAAGLTVAVQPSQQRVYADAEYEAAGAVVREDLGGCRVVFGVKEIPPAALAPGGAYVFFSHTIKGQPHNMPMLKRLIALGATLIDYERIVDDGGRRLVFFGRHAGLAGMIDTFAVLGQRLAALGVDSPFSRLGLAPSYPSLEAARAAVRALDLGSLPASLAPFVVGFAGYGNVSQGAQEIFDLVPHETVAPADLGSLPPATDRLFKVVFKEADLVAPRDAGAPFVLQEYYDHPERYQAAFEAHAERLSVLVNCIYWTERYPRLLTREMLRRWHAEGRGRLLTVGDISCDIEGAVECTVKSTTPSDPSFVYDPATGAVADGVAGPGLAIMATDALPCELPREASESFTTALLPFVPAIAGAAYDGGFDAAGLPPAIAKAVILWRGELTPAYRYLEAATSS
jgi:saccharopine dehydrogenase (NAD+, L-lysine-forming)